MCSHQPLVHLSRTLATIRLIFGHSDPSVRPQDSRTASRNTRYIETQAREAEHEVNILTQHVNYSVEQIETLRIGLGELNLGSDLHIDQEALVPTLDRIYSILADLNSVTFEHKIHVQNLLKNWKAFSDVLHNSAATSSRNIYGGPRPTQSVSLDCDFSLPFCLLHYGGM
ncbi:hypothetical protein KEM48_006161 [Puccinia striiformis f. sp. tritici PST-130]|nr:hypothetical protein KEM48_006161 [Puccinia striiformis f. sp. tritici PST-130]